MIAAGIALVVAVTVEIHLHPVDELLQPVLRKGVTCRDVGKRKGHGVARLPAVYARDFASPPRELQPRNTGIRALIHHVVHFPAEGI